jgi:transcriptional regulator with XRE-family HTH domain
MQTSVYPFFRKIIEQWTVRIKRAGIDQKKLSELSGVHEKHLSKIMNFKIESPRVSTIDKVERALEKLGV